MDPATAAEGSFDAAPARVAAVLAGGAGRRMGSPKATVELAGRPLIFHVIATAREAGLSTIVIAKPGSVLPPLDCPVISEPAEPTHPLAGVIAALEHCLAPVVVLACDLPLLSPALLAHLAVLPVPFAMPIHPRAQPLVARYTPATLDRLRSGLAAREPLVQVAAALGGSSLGRDELAPFGDPARMFSNVNEPADLERLAEDALRRPEAAPRRAPPGG